jgi:hypothetical protein
MSLTWILDWLQHNKEWVFSGAGVSGFVAVAAFVRWIVKRPLPALTAAPVREPALRLNLAFGHLTYDGPPYLGEQMLLFTVANPSDRPTQLAGIRLSLKNGANMVFPHLEGEKRLPCMIEPGTSSKFWVPLSDVEASIRSRYAAEAASLHAVATDGVGNDYASNAVTIGKESS